MENLTLYNGAALIPAEDLKIQLFDDFIFYLDRNPKTTKTYLTNLRQFAAWLCYEAIRRPQRADIIKYKEYLASEHKSVVFDPTSPQKWKYKRDKAGNIVITKLKANTIKIYLQSVKQFFAWTASEGKWPNIAANIHPPKIKTDTHKKEAFTAADVLQIENSIKAAATAKRILATEARKDTEGREQRAGEQGKRLHAMYLLAVNCGLRTVEISRANVGDLEKINGQAYLYIWGKGASEADTKKGIAAEVYEAIQDYLQTRADGKRKDAPLFVATGNRSGGQRLAPSTISTMLKRALQQAGFDSEKYTAHSLRHTAGTNVQDITNNLYLTQRYMRHESPKTTEIYLHNRTEEAEAETAQLLYNHYHGKEQDSRERLESLTRGLTPAQLEQLANIAATMQAQA